MQKTGSQDEQLKAQKRTAFAEFDSQHPYQAAELLVPVPEDLKPSGL